ncbi:MAG TPA: hypothetical protein VKA60_08960 [Blastocatellia bacterium]|nr:hypothetical protein [Blastocatellia bacterium]
MEHKRDEDRHTTAAARWRRWPSRVVAALLVGLVIGCASLASAQDDPPPLPVDPTPLADLLTAQEKLLVAETHNSKKAIEVYMKIAETRIDAALAAVKNVDTRRAESELDVFQKAMGECVKMAEALTDDKRKMAKKVEQSLYKDLRTLESVERLFPVERVQFAEAAIKRAKRFRVQMLNIAIASGEVLKDPEADKPPKTETHDEASPTRPPVFQSRGLAALARPVVWRRQMPGDYLTEEEDQHVREAQAADDRIKVFMKIADRRLAALNPAPPPTDEKGIKKAAEEKKEWGELPKLGRADLLLHYARAIEEGMAKLEDAYEHNPKSKTLSKALDILREATDRHLQTLRALNGANKDEREAEALRRAIEQAEVANEGARKGVKAKSA